jgi:hypothetical protein
LLGGVLVSGITLYSNSVTRQYSAVVKEEVEKDKGAAGMTQYFYNARKNSITGQMDYQSMAQSEAALAKFQAEKKFDRTTAGNFGLNWQSMGPDNVGGRTRAILIDNQDPSHNTIFAGGVSGGLWKSTDGGDSWAVINDNMASLEISCIAQDANGVIYVGTGEGFAVYTQGEGFSTAMIGQGIFKSTDDGATFNQLLSTVPSPINSYNSTWAYVNRIAISPCNPSFIYAAVYGGLMISKNGGTTWSYAYNSTINKPINPTSTYGGDVKISADGSVIIAAINGQGYISYPNCSSPSPDSEFTKISNAKYGGIPTGSRIELSISPTNSNYMYASVVTNNPSPGKGFTGIYFSQNMGKYWYLIGPGGSLAFDPYNVGGGGSSDQGWYDNTMAVDPTNPGRVMVGGTTLWSWTQTSSGDTSGAWKSITTYYSYKGLIYGGGGDNTYIHPDEHAIVFDLNNPKTVYLGCDGGIYKSPDAGSTWYPMNRGYNVTQFYDIDMAPYVNASNGEGIIGGTQDNGTPDIDGTALYYEDAVDMSGGDGGDSRISFIDPNIFFSSVDYCTDLARGGNLSGEAFPGPFYTRTVGLNKGCNIDSLASLGQGCFVQPLALYENLYDPFTVDTLMWIADKSYSAGTTVYPVSPNGNTPFGYVLPKSVTTGDTLYVQDPVVGKIATSFDGYVWMCPQADNLAGAGVWMPIGSTDNGFSGTAHCMAWTNTGNELFVGTEGGQVFRFSNLNAVRDTSYIEGATGSIKKGAPGTFVKNTSCIVACKSLAVPFGGRDILSISVNPYNGNDVLVTLGNYQGNSATYVYYSSNALSASPTFTNVSGNLPPMPVYSSIINVLGTGDSLTALVGTEHGVYSTPDVTKKTWTQENAGAPNTLVLGMKQQTLPPWMCNNSGNVYIGTHGRGAWYTGNIGPLSVQNIQGSQPASGNIKVYPNPMSTKGTVEFTLAAQENVTMTVYDLQGKAVSSQAMNLASGQHLLPINTQNMSNGTYIVTLTGSDFKQSARIVVVK